MLEKVHQSGNDEHRTIQKTRIISGFRKDKPRLNHSITKGTGAEIGSLSLNTECKNNNNKKMDVKRETSGDQNGKREWRSSDLPLSQATMSV